MSILAMLKLVPRWMWLGLAVLAVMVGLTRWHNGRVDDAVARERDRLGAIYAQELADAQAKADEKTKDNAEATAQLDTNYYKEYQNATKNADYWRARALTERVPVCTQTANSTETRATGSVGDDPAADIGADRSLDVPSAAIIQLSESATKMKAQVEYLQGKVMTDAQTINGVSDEK